MVAQDDRLKAYFRGAREHEVQMHKAYNGFLFWASPVLVSTATFGAPELENTNIRQKRNMGMKSHSIFIKSASFLWEESPLKPMLRNICGEVSSGKSTLLAAILGEVPNIQGTIHVNETIAHVSQSAWIQTGTMREYFIWVGIGQ
ncbi:unnamed protein product [Camellia sinensis]